MKKHLSLSVLFLCLQTGFCLAQDSIDTIPTKKIRKDKFQVGLFFSPDYCNQTFKAVAYNQSGSTIHNNKEVADTLNSITNSSVAYSFGIDGVFHFTRHTALKTGFYYSEKIKRYNGFLYYNPISSPYGVYHLSSYKKEKTAYLEIPFAFNYSFYADKKRKYQLSIFAGILFSINCKSDQIKLYRAWDPFKPFPSNEDGFTSGNRIPFSIFYIGTIAGITVNYKLCDHFSVSASPVFKYFMMEFSNNARVSGYSQTLELPRSLGLAIGGAYSF